MSMIEHESPARAALTRVLALSQDASTSAQMAREMLDAAEPVRELVAQTELELTMASAALQFAKQELAARDSRRAQQGR
jgi:hypothetical protein